MKLAPSEPEHLETLKTWFADKESARQWGGPGIRYPFTRAAFLEDIRWQEMSAYSMLDEGDQLTAFGQYYERSGRCHLARLIVAPALRSKGIGYHFIRQLMNIGMSELGTNECSLFVMNSNRKAVRCYLSLNFVPAAYPPGQPFYEDINFMVYQHT
jgi:ribosomal protein S18 acetylase RimI-like enzyme